MSKKVAFITGITGMVGSHLADFLLENTDFEIHGLCRWRSDLRNIDHLTSRINEGNRIELHYGDINDMTGIHRIVANVNPSYVFHLAAQSFPKVSFDSPTDTYQTNILGTSNLLEALRYENSQAQVHVCASSEVFGRVPKHLLPIKEDCNFHPASPYAISKVGTDLIGRYYAEAFGLNVQTTRMFTHTGPRRGDVFAESSFAKQIALIEAGLIPPVVKVGNLESLRTFADVRDAVRAYYLLVTHNPISGAYYNIGGNFTCTIGEMLQSLLSLSKVKEIEIQIDATRIRPIDADLQVPDTTKFNSHTGWKPEISFEQTMSDLMDYWRNQVNKSEYGFLQR